MIQKFHPRSMFVYLKELKARTQDRYLSNICKNPKRETTQGFTSRWMNKHKVVCKPNTVLMKEVLRWMNLENILLSEISKTPEVQNSMILIAWCTSRVRIRIQPGVGTRREGKFVSWAQNICLLCWKHFEGGWYPTLPVYYSLWNCILKMQAIITFDKYVYWNKKL